jgi:hypothetical protein
MFSATERESVRVVLLVSFLTTFKRGLDVLISIFPSFSLSGFYTEAAAISQSFFFPFECLEFRVNFFAFSEEQSKIENISLTVNLFSF